MKKYLVFLSIIVLFLICSVLKGQSLYNENSFIHYKFNQLVEKSNCDTILAKKVKTYSYKLNAKGNIKDSTLISFSYFDSLAKISNQTEIEYKFDSLGREYEQYVNFGNGAHLYYRKLYDSNSKLIENDFFDKNELISSKTFYKYNNENNLIHTETFGGYNLLDTVILEKTVDYYYENKTLIKTVGKLFSNDFINITIKEFDENGNVIFDEYSTFYINKETENIHASRHFQYNSNDKLIKEISHGTKKDTIVTSHFYYENNLPKETIEISKKTGKIKGLIRYFY